MPTLKSQATTLVRQLSDKTGLTPDPVALEKYYALCNLADGLRVEFGGFKISLDVKSVDRAVIYIDTPDLSFEYGRTHPFFQLIQNADGLNFSQATPDSIRTTLWVDGLWSTQ